MPRNLKRSLRLLALLVACALAPPAAADDCHFRVVDDRGTPVPKFEVMIHTADDGYSKWTAGSDDRLTMIDMFPKAAVVDVIVRAPGHAPIVRRFEGSERNELPSRDTTLTLPHGNEVELRFHLPEGMTWPAELVVESFYEPFAGRVRSMR